MDAASLGCCQTSPANSRRSSATLSVTSTPRAVTTIAPYLGRTDDREEGVRDHGQGDVPGPRGILADLVGIQPDLAFGLLEGLLHHLRRPAIRTSMASGVTAGAKQT